jgi:hypothetical protein
METHFKNHKIKFNKYTTSPYTKKYIVKTKTERFLPTEQLDKKRSEKKPKKNYPPEN